MLPDDHDYADDLDDDPEEDWWEEKMQECGQTSDGTCMKAGTEYCDFECPFRD